MSPDQCRMLRAAQHVVVTLPVNIDVNTADQVTSGLLRALDERPAVLVADMTATIFCGAAVSTR